jgi:2-C-methyl-D-erythritol 4-phosphate cytidylyltransferase / 2-C-methyl-D-erythritol 2,4-cyclodiphosphate synthase
MNYPCVMTRVGLGYDSHRFADGRDGSRAKDGPLVLGGVRIEHSAGLAGHSDADAVLHAITDAILGAIGAGDIGEQFPDTEARWRGADSAVFVRHAVELARQAGLRVGNCDVTILCESPKLTPHKPAIRSRIAELLGVSPDRVGVKAKTNEGMGWIGNREGLAAMAVVTMQPAKG